MDETLKFEQGARLGQILDTLNITQTALSEKIKISQSTISAMIAGKREINRNAINAIRKYLPDVDTNWLLSGTGSMFLFDSEKKHLVNERQEEYGKPDPLYSLRRLVEDYLETKSQVEAMAAELTRLKEAVLELEERLN